MSTHITIMSVPLTPTLYEHRVSLHRPPAAAQRSILWNDRPTIAEWSEPGDKGAASPGA